VQRSREAVNPSLVNSCHKAAKFSEGDRERKRSYHGCISLSEYRQSFNQLTSQTAKLSKSDKKRKRSYHRFKSCFEYWGFGNYSLLWVMLSSAPLSDFKRLADHHYNLRKRIERKLGFKGLQHIQVKTREGNGVYHAIYARKIPKGQRPFSFYIPQKWLSANWDDIHGAPVVWVKRVGTSRADRAKLAAYCVSQYCADQDLFDRLSYARRIFGGPMAAVWTALKRLIKDRNAALHAWKMLLSGRVLEFRYPHDQELHIWKFIPPPVIGYDVEVVKYAV